MKRFHREHLVRQAACRHVLSLASIWLKIGLLLFLPVQAGGQKMPADYVNPFVGSSNYGATHPGAVCPNGMMSVSPFNVTGSGSNRIDKDERWWSAPYAHENPFFTGFSHVNLSGVGCPEMGALLLMPTTGDSLNVNHEQYGSPASEQKAAPGYYSCLLNRYDILAEVTATPRTAMHRYTFRQAGMGHVLLNLGESLSNESGAMVRRSAPGEVEGMKLLGTFCYENLQGVFPVYFVVRVEKCHPEQGYWKFQHPMSEVEAAWDSTQNTRKIYRDYRKEIAGDDVGAWFSFPVCAGEQVEVRVGVSFVSIANARLNLEAEQGKSHFDALRQEARNAWDNALGRILVEGGSEEQKSVFYTALYHVLMHPNVLQDVNGDYPVMESDSIGNTQGRNRYTVFSLWDTYRTTHPLLTLVFPDKQEDMLRSLMDMYREQGWLPRWELYGRETLTMEGDPAIPVIVDSYMKGLCPYDAEEAYQAMRKSAFMPGPLNPLRPDNDDYMRLGYVPLREPYDNSVSHALEYYVADHALAQIARQLGHADDAALLRKRAQAYTRYYCKEHGTFRPIMPDGKFLSPFNPLQGRNFEACPGFHEGSAWNYSFAVPHDVPGLIRMMGGKREFVSKLQKVFDEGLYDPTNEPDMAYPYFFSWVEGEAWRTQHLTREILHRNFTSRADGLPGNDDTGALSAWAVFSMMGFYPLCPGTPEYTLTAPVFNKITIKLDARHHPRSELVIIAHGAELPDARIVSMKLGGKPLHKYRVSHEQLVNEGILEFFLNPQPSTPTHTP